MRTWVVRHASDCTLRSVRPWRAAGKATCPRTSSSLRTTSPRAHPPVTRGERLPTRGWPGERALGQFAYDEGARWLGFASDLLEAAGADAAARCDALLALAEAQLMAGDAWRVVDELAPAALALAEGLGEAGRERAANVCRLALAGVIRYAGPGSLVGTPLYRIWAERAGRHAPPRTIERVHADIALADVLSANGALADTLALYQSALALARELDQADSLWYAAFQMLNWGGGPRHQAERLRLAQSSAHARTSASTRAMWARALPVRGDLSRLG